MDILQNISNHKFYDEPYRHVVIDNALDIESIKKLNSDFTDISVFKTINNDNRDDICSMVNKLFNTDYELEFEGIYEYSLYNGEDDGNYALLRDSHIDGASKKFQIILYIGNDNIEYGQFEFMEENDIGGFDVIKRIDSVHNRILIFENSENAWHRFWSIPQIRRKTINIPLVEKSNKNE